MKIIANTTIKVITSFTPRETKKYPKYVGKKLLFANSISLTDEFGNWSFGSLLAIIKLNAVKIIGIKINKNHEKYIE